MNIVNQPNQPNKPRTHLFSPHTDQCIYCGKSAQDDAIENTPCVPLSPNQVEPAATKLRPTLTNGRSRLEAGS